MLLARTVKREDVEKRTEGLSVYIIDMRNTREKNLAIRPIRTMLNYATTEVFFDELIVPQQNLIGIEGQGFGYIIDGMNAEKILIASECIGDSRWFNKKAIDYANERIVFERQIGKNQGIQFPIAQAHDATEAAALMTEKATLLYEAGKGPVFDLHHFTLSGENSGNNSAKLSVLDHHLQIAVSAEAQYYPY